MSNTNTTVITLSADEASKPYAAERFSKRLKKARRASGSVVALVPTEFATKVSGYTSLKTY